MKQKKYYVYAYLDPRKEGNFEYNGHQFNYEPFYIGKGTGKRYLKHLCETSATTINPIKFRIIRAIQKLDLEPIITKLIIDIDESSAYIEETKLIKLIGRRCDNTGSLSNILFENKPPTNYIQVDKQTVNKIIDLYNSGGYIKHIGQKVGLNENKIKSLLIENGIIPIRKAPTNKLSFDNDIILKLVEGYNEGLSIRSLRDKYGVSFNLVRKILVDNQVVLKGYNYKKSKAHINKIVASRDYKYGEDNECFKQLTQEQIEMMKHLRFVENKPIKSILNTMRISQKKFYEYINI